MSDSWALSGLSAEIAVQNLPINRIQIRDPYVLPVAPEGRYYLFGTTDKDCWGPVGTGFDVYRGKDLQIWEGPIPAFRPLEDFWATRDFWAPECHPYQGRYYLFASFKSDAAARGTQILVADKPEGPYRPHSKGPVTPRNRESLDGTLFLEGDGAPWLIFCHEWVEIKDGTICGLRLSRDLRYAIGEPVVLFCGSAAPWSVSIGGDRDSHVTDGPSLYRNRKGELIMLWSTVGSGGYTLGYAVAENGRITGPWKQHPEPLFRADGGHGMLFRTFEGQLLLTLHQPNETPNERARFFPVRETPEGRLRLVR